MVCKNGKFKLTKHAQNAYANRTNICKSVFANRFRFMQILQIGQILLQKPYFLNVGQSFSIFLSDIIGKFLGQLLK